MTKSNIITSFLESQIYAACLDSHSDDLVHDVWIKVNQSKYSIHDKIDQMLFKNPKIDFEERAIHDYKNFGCYELLGKCFSFYCTIIMVKIVETEINKYFRLKSTVLEKLEK